MSFKLSSLGRKTGECCFKNRKKCMSKIWMHWDSFFFNLQRNGFKLLMSFWVHIKKYCVNNVSDHNHTNQQHRKKTNTIRLNAVDSTSWYFIVLFLFVCELELICSTGLWDHHHEKEAESEATTRERKNMWPHPDKTLIHKKHTNTKTHTPEPESAGVDRWWIRWEFLSWYVF